MDELERQIEALQNILNEFRNTCKDIENICKKTAPKNTCKECGGPVYAKGLCKNCYARDRYKKSIVDKSAEAEADRKYHQDHWRELIAIAAIGTEFELPPDFNETMDALLDELAENEQDVLAKRYRDMLTRRAIAHEKDLSSERIRQIECKALRDLRTPYNARLMQIGMAENEQEMRRIQEFYRDKVNGKAKWENINGAKDLAHLELSMRAYNCLARAGCKTITDVARLAGTGKLLEVRNLGYKSRQEILSKLYRIGWEGHWYTAENGK